MQAIQTFRVPWQVHAMNPLMKTMLRLGLPVGPAVLLTARGRKTGRPRTTPVGLFERDSRRWLFAEFGQVDWVRNLRATPRAEIRRGRRRESVVAVELSLSEAAAVLHDVVVPWLRTPGGRMAGVMASRPLLNVPMTAPVDAFITEAERYPIFEVKAAE